MFLLIHREEMKHLCRSNNFNFIFWTNKSLKDKWTRHSLYRTYSYSITTPRELWGG